MDEEDITCPAPRCLAAITVSSPTGPQPSTSTDGAVESSSPSSAPIWRSLANDDVLKACFIPFSAQKNAVDRMSPSSTPSSSLTFAGI